MKYSNTTIGAIKPQDRVVSLDILRGVALFGIALVNILGFNASFFDFGGFYSSLPDVGQVNFYQKLIGLCADKFIFLFSFLFGYGIWLQYHRFSTNKGRFTIFFSRRMAVLALFGLAHILFLWAGDILLPYAIAGMIVLALRKLPSWSLILIGLFFYFFVIFWLILSVWIPLPDALSSTCPTCLSHALDIYANGDYVQIFNLRLIEYAAFLPINLFYYLPKIIGITLFGFVASKAQFHLIVKTNRQFWLWIYLAISAVAIVAHLYYESAVMSLFLPESVYLTAGYMMGYEFMNLFVASAYIMTILLLCTFKITQNILKPLSFPGRMSLTNYLLQSVLFGFVFYGWGWGFFGWQKLDQIELIAVLVFILEIIFSYFWLQKFEQGPLEKLWRNLSYRKPRL